jgi:predicted AAA+ superfamily ATPase
MYPEVMLANSSTLKRDILHKIISGFLFKDILEIENVRNPKLLLDLLTLIAYQIGGEVSLNELASNLGVNARTVARYLDLFEKNFIIYNLRGFSRNLRSEVTQTSKYFFYDNGIRNAVIGDFNLIERRGDKGGLWENFAILERLKYRTYSRIYARDYFWRTWEQQEVDLVENRDGQLYAYEFKYAGSKTPKLPNKFANAYPDTQFQAITTKSDFSGFFY